MFLHELSPSVGFEGSSNCVATWKDIQWADPYTQKNKQAIGIKITDVIQTPEDDGDGDIIIPPPIDPGPDDIIMH